MKRFLILLFLGGCVVGPSKKEIDDAHIGWCNAVDRLHSKLLGLADSYAGSNESAEAVGVAIVSECSSEIAYLTDAKMIYKVMLMGNDGDVQYMIYSKRRETESQLKRDTYGQAVSALIKAREKRNKTR